MTAGLQVIARTVARISIPTLVLVSVLAMLPAVAGPLETLPAGHWYEVPNSRLSSVDPCPARNCSYSGIEGQAGVLDDWNGGAFASGFGTLGTHIVWGGGHAGYLGNELYGFDVAQLRWSRVTEPVNNPVCNYNEGELQDGSPCSAHSYDYVDYHPGTNSFIKLGSTSNHDQGGAGSPRVHLFNFTTKQWRRGARRADFADQTGSSSAYDPTRDVFWFLGPFNNWFAKYDPNANGGAGAWTNHQRYNIEIDAVAAIDPVRDLYVVIEGRVTRQVIVFDLKQPASAPVIVRTSGDSALQQSKGNGFEWDPVNRAFVGWRGGTSVYMLRTPSGDWKSGTWEWTRVDAAPGNTVNPGAPNDRGTYSRWRYVPALNVFVVVNRVNDNVFFYKLSDAAPLPQVSLQASETQVAANALVALTWSATNASSCTASGGWSGTKALSGTETVGPLASTSTFTLTCAQAGGSSVSRSVTVNVASNTPAPTVNLTANPASVDPGGSSVLSWTTSNATSCTASGGTSGWPGPKALSGSATVGPINNGTTFNLSCTGAGGTRQATAQVTLTTAPSVSLQASRPTVQSGETVTLSWTSNNANSCTAQGSWSGTKATSGSQTTSPINATSIFVLECTGAGGSTSASVTVSVSTSVPPSQPVVGSEGGGGRLDMALLAIAALASLVRLLGARTFGAFWAGLLAISMDAFAAPVTSVVVTSTSNSAQSQVPISFGQVFTPGDVTAGTSLAVSAGGSAVPTQVDVKARHADGSVRHAILSMRLPSLPAASSSQLSLSIGSSGSAGSALGLADLLATSFDAEARLTVAGTLYTARARDLLTGSTPLQWLAGPYVSEWIVGGPVRTAGGAAHPHLAAYFHVRAYGPAPVDRVRVDIVIENGWTLVQGPGNFDYSADLRVAGTSVYQRTLTHYHHARWHKQFWWPSAPQYTVRHDTRYLQATRAVPAYANIIVPDSYLGSLRQDATPMSNGDLTQYFPNTGAQEQIGPLPIWGATYIVSGADTRALRNLLANDDSAGSYSVHYRDEATGYPVSIADRPTLTLQTNDIPSPNGSNPNVEDGAHQPSIGFVSYLVTGDYFYLEEMQFWTSWNHLWANAGGYRQGAKGIFGSQVRNQAWALRNLAQSAYATPDNHRYKSLLVSSVGHNIANYEQSYSSNASANNLGAVRSYDGYAKFSAWQDDFLTWTLAYLVDLGFNATAIRDWKLKFPVNRMGTTEHCYRNAAVYTIVVGTSDSSWYPTFRALYEANFGPVPTCPEGGTMSGYPDSPSGYPANLRPALAVAVDAGYAGATDAWRRLLTSTPQPDFSQYPNWAVVPRSQLPAVSATLSLGANVVSVAVGGTATLSWSAANVTSCAASGGWNGSRGTSGTETVGPLSATTSFSLRCEGNFGAVERTITVQVGGSTPTPAPTLTFSASPNQVVAGSTSQLSWSTTNATSCMAAEGWSGSRAVSGTQAVGPLQAQTTFRLDCAGQGGSVSRSVTVAVSGSATTPDPPPGGEDSGGGGALGLPLLFGLGILPLLAAGTRRRP